LREESKISPVFSDHLRQVDSYHQYTLFVPPEIKFDFDIRAGSNFAIKASRIEIRLALVRAPGIRSLASPPEDRTLGSPGIEGLKEGRALNSDVAVSIPGYIFPTSSPSQHIGGADIQHEYFPEFFLPTT